MIKTSFFLFLITFSLEASAALPRFVVERGVTCLFMAAFKGCWDTEPANDPAVPGQVCYKDDKTGKILVAKDKCDSESSLVTQYECAELTDKSGKKIKHIGPVPPQVCPGGCDEKKGACFKAECVDHDATDPDPLLKPSFVEVFYPGMPSQTYGDGCLKEAPTMVNEMVCNSDKSGFMSTGQPCPAGFHCQMDGQGYGYCVPPWCTDLNPSDPSKPFDSSNSAGIQAGWGSAPPTTTPNTCLKDFPLPLPGLDPALAAQPDKILLDMTCLDLNKDGKYGEGDIPWLPTPFVCPGVCLPGQGKCSDEPTVDECKVMSDPAKVDPDNDGLGYKCDNCLTVPNPDQKDSDTDGLGDACDNCPTTANADQGDSDGDKAGNACDLCPSDVAKTNPGVCGCGQSEVDSDQDGQPDCQDGCPNDPKKVAVGICGCGVADVDSDQDGKFDCQDNCPLGANADQLDSDGDKVGDACDNCPMVSNPPDQCSGEWKQVSAGDSYTCAVRTDGKVVCWGSNTAGQSNPPTKGIFTHVSAWGGHTCGLKNDGHVLCWGAVLSGQLNPPVPGGDFTQVAVNYLYSCVLKTDGKVVCWGSNTSGQSNPPTGVFTQVSAGNDHVCGLQTDGKVVCWGSNLAGQLIPPAGVFTQVSAGNSYTCGVRNDGKVVCWGSNASGKSNPPEGNFSQVSAGSGHTCGLKTDGKVVCWGSNTSGQSNPPAGIFSQVSAGSSHTCGLKTDGKVVCWGSNAAGQLSPSTVNSVCQSDFVPTVLVQADQDGDGVGDVCDNCPAVVNPNQIDANANKMGDACEDEDADQITSDQDNCPMVANVDQVDSDGDKVGDACDNCPITADPNQDDADNDGVGNVCDNCVTNADGTSNCVAKARVISLCGGKKESWPFTLQMAALPKSGTCKSPTLLNCFYASEKEYFLFKITKPTLFTFESQKNYGNLPPKSSMTSSEVVKVCTHNFEKNQQSQYKKYDDSNFVFWNTSELTHYIVDYPGLCDPGVTLSHIWINPEEYNRLAIRVIDKNNVTSPPESDPSLVDCSVP